MPDMLIAPIAAAPTAQTLTAASSQGSAANAQGSDPAPSFSSALNQQIKSQAKSAQAADDASKSSDAAKNAKDAQGANQTASQAADPVVAADVMAALMPMLPPAGQTQASTKGTTSPQDTPSANADPAALQAMTIGLPNALAQTLTSSGPGTPGAALPGKGGTGADPNAPGIGLSGLGNSGKSATGPAVGPAIVASALSAEDKTANANATTNSANAVVPADFQSLLAASQSAQLTQPTGVATATVAGHTVSAMSTPFNTQGWSQEVGDRVVWMANTQNSRAELVLNPPQLGRVEISLTLNGDQASANFVAASPAVREALQNAMPQLREVLAGAGIQLGQAQVGADSSSQWSNQQETRHNGGSSRADANGMTIGASASAGSIASVTRLRQGNGLVDAFA